MPMEKLRNKGQMFKENIMEIMESQRFQKLCDEEFHKLVIAFENVEKSSQNVIEGGDSIIFFEETGTSLLKNISFAQIEDKQYLIKSGIKVFRRIIENENKNQEVYDSQKPSYLWEPED